MCEGESEGEKRALYSVHERNRTGKVSQRNYKERTGRLPCRKERPAAAFVCLL